MGQERRIGSDFAHRSRVGWPGRQHATPERTDDQHRLVEENRALKAEVLELANVRAQAAQLKTEQTQLWPCAASAASDSRARGKSPKIVRDARNPYARKIIVLIAAAATPSRPARGNRRAGVVGRSPLSGRLPRSHAHATERATRCR